MNRSSFRPSLASALVAFGALLACATTVAVAQSPRLPERAVRRDIPMTNTIRRALAAGVRDSTGRPGRNYWQLRTDYTINARLDPATSRISGRERIDLWNNSPDSLRQLVFRLDMNMFLFNVARAVPWVPAELTDGFVVTRIAVNGDAVSLAAPQGGRGAPPPVGSFVSGFTTTRGTVNLAKAIPAGARASIEVEWSHKVPGGPGSGHRMVQRWADTLYQPTQWYPRLAVYDDLRGWDPELYLGPAEFYNNFGKFDVSIDVPAGWIVSGTGVLQNPQDVLTQASRDRLARVLESDAETMIVTPDEVGPGKATAAPASGDRLVWRFVADTVNDFAWATAKKFVWRSLRANIPGKGFVPVHMYYQPGAADRYEQAGVSARHALEFYSKLWFPYQFPQLTLQDGPSAGMEYPMVINSNAGAADHETGHQWWPMTVSNNETWYGWMDEGFDQYMNILSDADRRGASPNLDGRGRSYGNSSGDENEAPMMWNSNYGGPFRWSFMTYSKTPLMLSMLGGVVGSDTVVQRAHSDWGKAWLFKHPSPWDYMFFMNNALRAKAGGAGDLSWFWNYWLFTTESVEGSLECGDLSGSKPTVTVRQSGQMPSPIVMRVDFDASGPAIKPMPNSVLVGDKSAIVTWPADVWFAGDRTYKAQLNFGGRRIEKITLDPGGRFPDKNIADNQCPRVSPALP